MDAEIATGYSAVIVLILAVAALCGAIALATHVIGPRRTGDTKMSTYESGMMPVGDARRRFNVRFYLVAVLFIVFDVELVFLYPWATVFGPFHREHEARTAWAVDLMNAGYTPMYLLGASVIFFLLLLVGFIYEWQKGIFKWD